MLRFRRLQTVLAVALCLFALTALVGCGGGSSPTGVSPNAATRAAVKQTQTRNLNAMGQSGVAPLSMIAFRFGVSGARPNPIGGPATGAIAAVAGNAPMTGAFLLNQMTNARTANGRAARLNYNRLLARTREGDSSGGSSGGAVGGEDWLNKYYYDEYLGLWVFNEELSNGYRSLFYEDEAKTKPAGSMETRFPANSDTYPQEYLSEYRYTAGALKGASGRYVTTFQQDGTSTSDYNSVEADGSREQGRSVFNPQGRSSWQHRRDGADGSFSTASGEFLADGSGRMGFEASDGFASEYVFNTDGTGNATMRGPLPGLPATLTWTAEGVITIRYADGTIEVIQPGWVDGGEGAGGTPGVEPQPAPMSNTLPPSPTEEKPPSPPV